MEPIFAVFTAMAGLVVVLAGAHGLRHTRRIVGSCYFALALVKPPPRGALRPLLAYETLDGRVVEIVSPVVLDAATDSVRLWYDPTDPHDVVIDGYQRRGLDRALIAAGVVLLAIGLGLAAAVLIHAVAG
ncbi:hypothetical protein ABZ348_08640 [Streptomyces sp. NPDC005963]|uniref:hypothetical protein n=1 Tax=Streptomyces sp. NPDC005963 TaxID=3156721 RepID=UPI0033F9B31E